MSIMAKTPSGYKKIGSAYLGERPVDKVFNANGDVIYALQRELTGVPPLLFKGKEQSELLNYRICGNTETKQRDYSGSSPLTVPVHDGELYNYRIYGNTVNGESVGDRTGNLFDGVVEQGSFNKSNGALTNVTNRVRSSSNSFIYLKAGSYTIDASGVTDAVCYVYSTQSTSDYVYSASLIDWVSLPLTFSLNNDYYCLFGFKKSDDSTIIPTDISNIMLNAGSTALPYEPYGYKVPITVTNSGTTSNETIYLPEPIKMVGSEVEYVDFYSQKQYFADGTNTAVTIPALPISTGTNTVTVNTTVQPSSVEVSVDENVSVGDLVTTGQHAGEYKVPVTVSNGTDTLTTPIYLPEPIKMEAHQADFVDYATQTFQTRKVVYGWHVDPTISDSFNAVTYLEDAVGMTPAAMGSDTFNYGSWKDTFFMPKPCMLKSDGTVDYYLNPNDYTKKADGTPSDVANSDYDGNAMMEWGKIWYKFAGTEVDGEGYFYVSNYRVDNTYHCWCNIDSENNETDHFYTAIYNGTGTTKLRSISGIALTSANGNGGTNFIEEVTRATANNTTSAVEWYTEVFSDKLLINALLVLMGKSLNTQVVFGRGLDSGGQTTKEAYITGTLNDKGLFWGVTANGNSAVKAFGMENWWGCVWHRVAGCISVNNTLKVKLTYNTADGSTTNGYNQTGSSYIDNGDIPTSNGYLKTMRYNKLGYSPSRVIGSSSESYYGDYFYQNAGTDCLLFGGTSGSSVFAGAFYSTLHAPDYSAWSIAAALSCKPLAGKNPEPGNIRSISLPALPTIKGTNTMSVDTEVQPSRMDIKGRIKTLT